MNNFIKVLVLLTFCFGGKCSSLGHVADSEKGKIKKIVHDGWNLSDIANLHYAVATYRIIGDSYPISEKVICDYLTQVSSTSHTVEDLYHIVAVSKLLTSCKTPLLASEIPDPTGISLEEKFYWGYIYDNIGTDTAKKVHTPTSSINDSIINLGYSLHLASLSSVPIEDTRTEFNKISKILLRADEIDEQFLQFEGGLTSTAIVVSGIYRVADKLKESPKITNEQVLKFTRYLLSRLNASKPKAVYILLEALDSLVNNMFHVVASVEVVDKSVAASQPTVTVRVSNLLGQSLTDKSLLTVEAAYSKTGAKSILKPTSSSHITEYTLNAKELKLGVGHVSVDVILSLAPNKLSKKILINPTNQIKFIITTSVSVKDFQIGVVDSERSSSTLMHSVTYPSSLGESLTVDSLQRLLIKFSIIDTISEKPTVIHQVFVKLKHIEKQLEAIFSATVDSSLNYRLNIDIGQFANQFHHLSGKYELVLLIADSIISSPVQWKFAVVSLKFPITDHSIDDHDFTTYYKPKPEIKHTFKEPEKRPPVIVSLTFTVLVLTPLVLLFALWINLDIDINNFPMTLSAVGFHGGLGCIFSLFGMFWLHFNMFETIKYLLGIGLITFLCGHKMLSQIASKRVGSV